MKRVASIKLIPTPQEADVLRRTLERVNEACNWPAARAFESRTIRQFDLHKLCYRDLRKHFELAAQVAIRCFAKVVAAIDDKNRPNQATFSCICRCAVDADVMAAGSIRCLAGPHA